MRRQLWQWRLCFAEVGEWFSGESRTRVSRKKKAATNGPLLTAGSKEFRTAEEPRTTPTDARRAIDPAAAGEFVFPGRVARSRTLTSAPPTAANAPADTHFPSERSREELRSVEINDVQKKMDGKTTG